MSKDKGARKLLNAAELSVFCAQVAMILKAGIPLYEGLAIMREDMDGTAGRDILRILDERVGEGASFHEALAETGMFPGYMTGMVRVGEASGRLDEVLQSLSEYYERERVLKERIQSAVLYPMLLIVMMSVVILVLIMKVLPVFNEVVRELGGELSAAPAAIMNAGMAAGRWGLIALGVLSVLVLAVVLLSQTQHGSAALGRFLARFAPTRRLAEKLATGRFAAAMALMLASGLDTDEALRLAPPVVNHPAVADKIGKCAAAVKDGESFPDAVGKAGLFSGVYARMVKIGFKAGSTDVVMKRLADAYDDEVDDRLGTVVSMLEPALVAVLSAVIGVILISVMLPLMSIMTALG